MTTQNYVYDKNGNLIQDATGRTFAYDANNKQKEAVAELEVLPQIGIIWSPSPSPITLNGTYSPMSASDGFNLSFSYAPSFVRTTTGAGINSNLEPSVEGGGGTPGVTVGLFYVYRPSPVFLFDNTNSSEGTVQRRRNEAGIRPPNHCFAQRCNSSTNTNSNTNTSQ